MAQIIRPTDDKLYDELVDLRKRVSQLERMPSGKQSLGVDYLAAVPRISARRTTTLTIATATWSSIDFTGGIDIDPDVMWSSANNNRFTFKTAGFWLMGCQGVYGTNFTTGSRICAINFNSTSLGAAGTQIARSDPNAHSSGFTNDVQCSIGKQMAVNDFVIPVVYHDAGVSIDLITTDSIPTPFTFWAVRASR